MKKRKGLLRIADVIADMKEYPDAAFSALLSALVMGLGQLRNKQKAKAAMFFGIFLAFLILEVATSGYWYAAGEIARYPAAAGEKLYFFRDYGGLLTSGIWGLLTLGKVPGQTAYRGQTVETFHRILPWLSADNSVTLLGVGLIALVICSLLIVLWGFNVADAYQTRKRYLKTGKQESVKAYFKRVWGSLFAYIMLVPSLVMVLFFILIPFLFSFLLAFTNYTYRLPIPNRLIQWVGFENFSKIVTDPGWFSIFAQVVGWTFLYATMASVTCYLAGMVQALIIESKYVKFKKFWRSILIIPWAVPSMVSLMVFKNVFHKDGLANQLLYTTNLMEPVSNFLHQIGLQAIAENPIFWFTSLGNGNLAKFIIILVNLWLGSPYFMMLITGVLTTVPKDLYEAASIDGASKWQSFKKITFPLIIQATIPAIIMTFTFNFNGFGSIYFLTGGGPRWANVPNSMKVMGGIPGQTDILISWIYKLSFDRNAQLYNIAAVYSILIFVFIASLSIYNLAKQKNLWED